VPKQTNITLFFRFNSYKSLPFIWSDASNV
jgi:hypothetical protein